ncbi:MAG TPA: DUF4870 domain-containing protein [Ignavibacteria bacterium]|jgi:uncharacterized Tic20 family protein
MSDSFGAPADTGEIKSDEKLLALFSHLSLFLGGILLPLIFWLTNKDKSKFVTFHSLQALWFHISYVVLIAFIMVFVVLGGMGISILVSGSQGKEMPPIMIVVMIAFYALLFLFIFGGIGYSIFMGIKSYQGAFIKYPVIGNIVYKRVYSNV